jgi:hypothetical protein
MIQHIYAIFMFLPDKTLRDRASIIKVSALSRKVIDVSNVIRMAILFERGLTIG